MHSLILTTLLPLTLALSSPMARQPLTRRQTSFCPSNAPLECDDACMPVGSICCNEGTGTSCDAGTYCTADGCCPIGEICVGGGGTIEIPGGTIVSTITIDVPVPDETSTVDFTTTEEFEEPTSTEDSVPEPTSVEEESSTAIGVSSSRLVVPTSTPVVPTSTATSTAGHGNGTVTSTGTPEQFTGAAAKAVAVPGLMVILGQLVFGL
ncbi:hypothetical protein BS50DRAFT_573056 [Corynespora cassiicola Philippines]|uniref:GPI anchored serine-threonine rich protein n=1 Tax=Corynespora cassiicola Philippines TaxID=1448308 RepID=A0A2T2NRS9_CORCC|nr:hypothetical protein BS50DRAFT_573056 [Corynespora cassiicola Philippines]